MEKFLDTIPGFSRGPGGAVAVVKDGELVARRVWGYADLERRIKMTERTQMPICSISKQMVVLVLMSLVRDALKKNGDDLWQSLDAKLRKALPQLFKDSDSGQRQLKVEDLFNMQSGIRDYWAMTVLWGARAEDPFSVTDHAPMALERTRSFHFLPGSEFSYSNVNFHILGRLLEKVSGHSLGQLLSQHLLIPAGMSTAALCPNTAGPPLPIVGYEGTEKAGYFPAVNRIEWEGDAGNVASLDDMIAYEKYLDRSWQDKDSLYHAIAKSSTFSDGNWASYSHGLWHRHLEDHETIGHTGGLRGFRLSRTHVPDARLSVVVMLNHEASPKTASDRILKYFLGLPEETPSSTVEPAKAWEGYFFAEKEQRVITVEFSEKSKGQVLINYGGAPEEVKLTGPDTAESPLMTAKIEGDTLHLTRAADNVDLSAQRIPSPSKGDMQQPRFPSGFGGEYYCEEADSTFFCYDSCSSGGIVYGSFAGYLGHGPAHIMRYVGSDIWILICPRTMDAPAPGEWTIVFRRDDDGRVKSATIGCWLARKLEFIRKE